LAARQSAAGAGGNIANADTPNLQGRDFDFAAALQNALSGRVAKGALPLR
jgi:flagellar basal body rod protein FlgB